MEIEQVALDAIEPYPLNPRKGDIKLIAESLQAYGQYKPITVNKRTNEILAGNHTYAAAKELGWETISVNYIDVDENTAAKIVLMDNKTSDVGSYNEGVLLGLLDSLDSLSATGYTDGDLSDLQKLYDKPDNGMTNTKIGTSLTDYADSYNNRTSRIIMLDYEINIYNWIVEQVTKYKTDNGLTNNSDAIIAMLESQFNEEAPVAE
jgi:ParB-like nuclease domain